jgi:NAD(P)H-dependent FMN reductase
MARILVFSGSIRTGSFNTQLATAAARALAEAGAEPNQITLKDFPLPIYDGDLEAAEGPPENAKRLAALFAQHRGVFIACPEYNASTTPLLKNAIDWVSRVKTEPGAAPYKHRVFALGAASNGALGGYRSLMMMRQTLELGLQATVLPEMVSVPGAAQAFDESGALKDRPGAMLKTLAARLAAEAGRLG